MSSGSAPIGEEEESVADQLASLAVMDGAYEADSAEAQAEDPELWKPHPPNEDCPVCMVPLPHPVNRQLYFFGCCGKKVCSACCAEHIRAEKILNTKRAKKDLATLDITCPFCRTPIPSGEDDDAIVDAHWDLAKRGNALGITELAGRNRNGQRGFPQKQTVALDLYQHAADLGCADAIGALGKAYAFGELGVHNNEKGIAYLARATKMGHVGSRYYLALFAADTGNMTTAIRHFRLAAEAGYESAMKKLWKCFYEGKLSKIDLEDVLRKHKQACDEMSSEERERHRAYNDACSSDNNLILRDILIRYYDGELNAKEMIELLEDYGYSNYKEVE